MTAFVVSFAKVDCTKMVVLLVYSSSPSPTHARTHTRTHARMHACAQFSCETKWLLSETHRTEV